jgi:hypothetical protein
MYIEKRWLLPAALSLLLLGALFALVLLLLGSRVPEASGSVRAAEIKSAVQPSKVLEPVSQPTTSTETPAPELAPPAPALEPPAKLIPAPEVVHVPHAEPVVVEAAPSIQPPEEAVEIDTRGSENTQINTRGFGDIGMQFQDVTINAPITNIHISSQGNNNATNLNIGDHDTIISEQKRLQSNRSDGAVPPVELTSTEKAAPESGADATTSTEKDAPPTEEAVPVPD